MTVHPPALFPGKVLIDPRENAPFAFTELPLSVPSEMKYLATGDYSIEGFTDRIAIERKSRADLETTLSVAARRSRFRDELARLAALDVGVVLVEASWDEIYALSPTAAKANIVSLRREFATVPWRFCDGRRAAEIECYSILLKFAEAQV